MLKKILIVLIIGAFLFGCSSKKENESTQKQGDVDIEFYHAPLPKFSQVYSKLDHLETDDFDEAIGEDIFEAKNDVYRSAFALGVLSSDAILTSKARNSSKLNNIAQAMIEYSKMVEVDKDILKLADELKTLIDQEKWNTLETTLDQYKKEVELSFYESKEYDLFTMLQLGGWVEGLNRITFLLDKNYQKDKTSIINERGILNQLISNTNNLKNPNIKKEKYYDTALSNLKEIKEILYSNDKGEYTKEQIKEISKLTAEIKKMIE